MSEEQKQAPQQKTTGWYRFARIVGTILTHTVCPVRYHGVEQVAREGAYILIANHSSWIDPVILSVAVKKRDVTFLGKKELTGNKLVKSALTGMHMIIVDRHNADMKAMRECIGALRKGEILGIFPEGTRHHEGVMEQLESGTALIALRSGVPMVPALIASKPRLFHVTHVYFGDPIDYADLRAEGVSNETGAKLMERIRGTYRGMIAAK